MKQKILLTFAFLTSLSAHAQTRVTPQIESQELLTLLGTTCAQEFREVLLDGRQVADINIFPTVNLDPNSPHYGYEGRNYVVATSKDGSYTDALSVSTEYAPNNKTATYQATCFIDKR